jgi:hypothetical protein
MKFPNTHITPSYEIDDKQQQLAAFIIFFILVKGHHTTTWLGPCPPKGTPETAIPHLLRIRYVAEMLLLVLEIFVRWFVCVSNVFVCVCVVYFSFLLFTFFFLSK